MLTDSEVSLPNLCCDQEDMSRSQSPLIPLTIENTIIDIKTEPHDYRSTQEDNNETEEEDILNSSLTAMDWLPKLNARAGVVEEEVPDEEKKPPYSYASLIRLAILNAAGQKATLSDIYTWIQDQFLYYKNQTNPGWKNSIRHNLSLNKCFMKVARTRQDPGKGCYWAINHLYQHDKQGLFEKKKKNFLFSSEMVCSGPQMTTQASFLQDLQNNCVQQVQQQQSRQLQQVLAHQLSQLQAQIGAEQFLQFQTQMSAQQSSLPLLLPIHQQNQVIDDKTLAQAQSSLPMLMDDWATSSEADLSQSLIGYAQNQFAKVEHPGPVLNTEDSLPIITSNQASSLLGPDQAVEPGLILNDLASLNRVKEWPEVKTEASSISYMEQCVNPTEIVNQTESSRASPDEMLGMTESGKLPSLWSDLGRMSWLGFGERASSEWLEMGTVREVPEQDDEDGDLDIIDYDKLL